MSLLLAAMLLAQAPEQDPKAPPRTGRFRGDVVDPVSGEVIMHVRYRIPEKLPRGKTLGFIFVCHGFKGHENNSYLDGTVDALTRRGVVDEYIVVAGKSLGDGWTQKDDPRVLRLYGWARENYPVDPRRFFLFGSSNGAAFVCRFGLEHQDLVAGVVSYCGGFKFEAAPRPPDAASTKTEWYFVHGGKDHPENSGRACSELRSRGYRYVFRQLDGYGHTDIWDGNGHPDKKVVDAVRDDWARWLHALRHKELPPEAGAPKAVLDGALVRAALGRLPGPAGAERDRDLELLADAALWRYPEAQEALCRLAKDPAARREDRQWAVRALGRAVRLMILGNFEDKTVLWTLVRLLEDGDSGLREAAYQALLSAPESFELRPRFAEDSLSEWKSWCTQNCGPSD